MRLLLAAIVFAFVLNACNTAGCMDNRSSVPIAGFCSSETGKTISTDSIEIGGVGAPNDSLLVSVGQKVSQFYIPFRFMYDETSFYINYKWKDAPKGLSDTITFRYTSIPYFASEECGAMYRYTIESVGSTNYLIDSVSVVEPLVTNMELTNVKIYFPTSAE